MAGLFGKRLFANAVSSSSRDVSTVRLSVPLRHVDVCPCQLRLMVMTKAPRRPYSCEGTRVPPVTDRHGHCGSAHQAHAFGVHACVHPFSLLIPCVCCAMLCCVGCGACRVDTGHWQGAQGEWCTVSWLLQGRVSHHVAVRHCWFCFGSGCTLHRLGVADSRKEILWGVLTGLCCLVPVCVKACWLQ